MTAADARFREAITLHQQGRLAEARNLYEEVLALEPDHAPALNFLGVLAYQSDDPERSVVLIEKAITADAEQPGFYSNLALSLNAVGRAQDAIDACDRALALDPGCVEAHSNKGNSLWGLGRREEALASYANALACDPGHAQTHWNEGFLRLQLGQFDAGWRKHEWRWQLPEMQPDLRSFAQPVWLGKENLAGRTILLYAEQGLGDTIQFCRYAKLVAALGATVLLEVQKPLRHLLAHVEGASQVLARGEALPAFDYCCPLLSLPLAFGTTLDTIPSSPAYLYCEPAEVAPWEQRLGARGRARVGLVWKASSARRSVPLAQLLALVSPHCDFFSLQNDLSDEERALLDARGIPHWTAGLRNFTDAPLVSLVDLVVTVDTSMAHLAGALGRPVWVMQPFNPEWRWLLGRDDSPWYPTARLFRQPSVDDWAGVISRIAQELPKQS